MKLIKKYIENNYVAKKYYFPAVKGSCYHEISRNSRNVEGAKFTKKMQRKKNKSRAVTLRRKGHDE